MRAQERIHDEVEMSDLLRSQRDIGRALPGDLAIERAARDVRRQKRDAIDGEGLCGIDDVGDVEVVSALDYASSRDAHLGLYRSKRLYACLQLRTRSIHISDAVVYTWAAIERDDHLVAPFRDFLRMRFQEDAGAEKGDLDL